MTLFILYATAYCIIGLVLGRVWHVACKQRRDAALAVLAPIFGVFWPLTCIIFPVVFAGVIVIERVGIPCGRWLFKKVDSVVTRVVPEKTG